jgi:hypothetical protein
MVVVASISAVSAMPLAEVALEGVVVVAADEGVVAVDHRKQDPPAATMAMDPSVRFVARVTMMHFSAGTASTKPINQRTPSNKLLL